MALYPTKFGNVEFETEEQYQSYLKMSEDESHSGYMTGRAPIAHVTPEGVDDRTARQHMRRSEALQEVVQQTVLHRVMPGTGISVEHISFNRWNELQTAYKQALAAGESHNSAMERVGFQPLAVYMNKLISNRKDGSVRKVRDLLVHEVGVRPNGTIVCLQDKMPSDLGTTVVGPHTDYKDPAFKGRRNKDDTDYKDPNFKKGGE